MGNDCTSIVIGTYGHGGLCGMYDIVPSTNMHNNLKYVMKTTTRPSTSALWNSKPRLNNQHFG